MDSRIGAGLSGAAQVLRTAWALPPVRAVRSALQRLARAVGAVVATILAALVFALVFVPAGCVLRLAGRDPLARRREPGVASYRVPSRVAAPDHMRRPY